MVHRFEVRVAGQTLAFERVVSAIRRRALEIRRLTFRAGAEEATSRISFAIEAGEHDAARLEANLWKIHEVVGIRRSKPSERQQRTTVALVAEARRSTSISESTCHSV